MSNKSTIESINSYWDSLIDTGLISCSELCDCINALEKQLLEDAIVNYHKGDISALIICPMCTRSIIVNIELYKESNDEWYCKDCGQKLTLRNFKE